MSKNNPWEYKLKSGSSFVTQDGLRSSMLQSSDALRTGGRHADGSSLSLDAENMKARGTNLLRGLSLNLFVNNDRNSDITNVITGYSGADEPLIAIATYSNGASASDGSVVGRFAASQTLGANPLLTGVDSRDSSFSQLIGVVVIGGDYIRSRSSSLLKNGSSYSFSGTARYGQLGHDPENSHLLVLYSTTEIARFSGIAGSTLTNLNDNITLSVAIDSQKGFAYEAKNKRIYAADTTNNKIYKFNLNGDVDAFWDYEFDDTTFRGLVLVENRLYAAFGLGLATTTGYPSGCFINLVPTPFTI
jgi:hypothetical protein